MIIDELRSSTGPLHKKLDHNQNLASLLSNHVQLEDYIQYLQLFAGIHTVLESFLSSHLAGNINFKPRLPHILNDLDRLGAYAEGQRIFLDPQLKENEEIGTLYVLEGSKLGGKFIYNKLKQNLDLSDNCFQFLNATFTYSWKDTINTIKNESAGREHETIRGARKTFKFILSYVDQFYEARNSKSSKI